jgi:putative CocE/NonD family hydrolase
LNGTDTGILNEPKVRYFLMGANEWRSASTWPPPGTNSGRWYLGGGKSGTAISLNDGRLSSDKPGPKERPDKYRYDPADPVPTLGGNTLYSVTRRSATGEENPDFSSTAGPRDQRPVEPRCLTFTSEPLAGDLEVIGPVGLTLFASSNCPDTDFVAKLCDVFPDGRSILVTDGILRARYRKSRSRPRRLKPKRIYRLTVDLWPTAWRFAAGHRLRLAVTSSNFPRFDRNPNTGEPPASASNITVATNTVYHEKKYPSHLTLPTLSDQTRPG